MEDLNMNETEINEETTQNDQTGQNLETTTSDDIIMSEEKNKINEESKEEITEIQAEITDIPIADDVNMDNDENKTNEANNDTNDIEMDGDKDGLTEAQMEASAKNQTETESQPSTDDETPNEKSTGDTIAKIDVDTQDIDMETTVDEEPTKEDQVPNEEPPDNDQIINDSQDVEMEKIIDQKPESDKATEETPNENISNEHIKETETTKDEVAKINADSQDIEETKNENNSIEHSREIVITETNISNDIEMNEVIEAVVESTIDAAINDESENIEPMTTNDAEQKEDQQEEKDNNMNEQAKEQPNNEPTESIQPIATDDEPKEAEETAVSMENVVAENVTEQSVKSVDEPKNDQTEETNVVQGQPSNEEETTKNDQTETNIEEKTQATKQTIEETQNETTKSIISDIDIDEVPDTGIDVNALFEEEATTTNTTSDIAMKTQSTTKEEEDTNTNIDINSLFDEQPEEKSNALRPKTRSQSKDEDGDVQLIDNSNQNKHRFSESSDSETNANKRKNQKNKYSVHRKLKTKALSAVFHGTHKKFLDTPPCNESDDAQEPLYCVCRQVYREDDFMIMCDLCEEWFHGHCININEDDAEDIEEYDCFLCCGYRTPSKGKAYNKLDSREPISERFKIAKINRQKIAQQLQVENELPKQEKEKEKLQSLRITKLCKPQPVPQNIKDHNSNLTMTPLTTHNQSQSTAKTTIKSPLSSTTNTMKPMIDTTKRRAIRRPKANNLSSPIVTKMQKNKKRGRDMTNDVTSPYKKRKLSSLTNEKIPKIGGQGPPQNALPPPPDLEMPNLDIVPRKRSPSTNMTVPEHMRNRYKYSMEPQHPFNRAPSKGHAPPKLPGQKKRNKVKRQQKLSSPQAWKQKIRDKVCLTFRAKIGVINGKKLEKYLFLTYGGGSKVWNERIYSHITHFRAIPTSLRKESGHCEGNMYVNKMYDLLDKLAQHKGILKVIKVGGIDTKDLLYFGDAKIREHILKSDPNYKMQRKLGQVLKGCALKENDDEKWIELAKDILSEAKKWSNGNHRNYVNKMRDLMYNLRKNQKLLKNVVDGGLKPCDLVQATNDKLASDDIVSKRQKIKDDSLKQQILTENLDKLKRDSYHTETSKILNFELDKKKKLETDYDISGNVKISKMKTKKKKKQSDKMEADDDGSSESESSDESDDDLAINLNFNQSNEEEQQQQTKEEKEQKKEEKVEAKKKEIGQLLKRTSSINSLNSQQSVTQSNEESKIKIVRDDDSDDDMNDDEDDDINEIKVIGDEDEDNVDNDFDFNLFDDDKKDKNDINDVVMEDNNEHHIDDEAENDKKKVSFALEQNQIKIQSDHSITDENELESEQETLSSPKQKPTTKIDEIVNKQVIDLSVNTSTEATKIVSDVHLLWKGKIFHNELVEENENGQQRMFGIKIYQIGGEYIYKLPGFESMDKASSKKSKKSKKNTMLMTGRIAHGELEKYIVKSLNNESKRAICCKITISKEVSEAQKLIKHLKHKERCSRFKVGHKNKKTYFDFYIIPPTKSNKYLNAQFVEDYFDAKIKNNKMWGVIVLPLSSFNKVHKHKYGKVKQQEMDKEKPKAAESMLDALSGLNNNNNKSEESSEITSSFDTTTTTSSPFSTVSSHDQSALDDKFFSNLDGLASILGVDDQIVSNRNEEQKNENVQMMEKPIDPRMRR